MQQVNAVCDLDDSSLTCQDKSPLHILVHAGSCARLQCNEDMPYQPNCRWRPTWIRNSPTNSTIFQVGIGISPNVTLNTYRCGCGDFHCKVTALVPIGPEDVLCSGIKQEAGTLIIQFDGPCHADKEVGGAGTALLELQTHGLTLLRWRAFACLNVRTTFLLRQCLQT